MDTNIEAVVATDNMDDLLSDLVLGGEANESAEDLIAALDDADTDVVEVMEEREAAIEGQTSEVNATTEQPAVAEKPAKKARAPKEKSEKAPKIERDLSALPDAVFELAGADRATVIAKRPEQKKIAEKFDNLFISLNAGRAPSVYTMACFKVVAEKGEATSSDLVAALKAAASRSGGAYSDGTARSQVGQLMALFDVVGVAKRDGNKLVFNGESAISERLKAF